MKAELTLPQELVDLIADKVIEKLKPLITDNCRQEDIFFDVPALAEYLKLKKGKNGKVSTKWVYERVQFKEIPYLKIKGLLRFKKKDVDKWLISYNIPPVNSMKA